LSIVQPHAEEPVNDAGSLPPAAEDATAAGAAEGDVGDEDSTLAERYMPEPRSAAIAVMALLAFGVVIGAATGPIAQSAGISPLVVEMGSSAPPPSEEPVAESTAEAPAEATAPASEAVPSALPAEPPPLEEAPPTPTTKPKLPPEFPEEAGLPEVEHVFLIVLGDHGFEEGFGPSSPAPYLAQTLRAKGELLSNYYAVTQGDLANEIALLSGQGPTQATASNCPSYGDVSPATVSTEEQVLGDGCVYPAATQTLPSQLATAKKTWKAYVEDASDAAPVAECGAYATARNPLAYFHSVLDQPGCSERDVGLTQLETDLKAEKTTPSLSYVVPNACHDGSEEPCEPGQPAGLAASQPFLEKVVPEIEASMAYKKSGLIAITFAQAPQTGAAPDSSACCATPEYPNLPPATTPPAASGPVKTTGGGGRVGLLLISPFIEAGSSNETGYYNHFSLLLSIEELFGLTPIGYAANPALSAFDETVYNQGS
jgi:phosphatidylinositol-3-phosphatase